MSQKILSVIPARKGSKGMPRKNLRELGEHPLVAHAIKTSKESGLIDHVTLTTDSQEIAQIGRQYDADTIINRPNRLSTDEVPLAPVVKHAFEEVEGNFEYVLCLQPTAPLISFTSIEKGVDLATNEDTNSIVFIKDSTHYYWKSTADGYVPVSGNRKNRQLMDSIYEEIGVFLTHRDLVKEGHRVGEKPCFHEVNQKEGIDIDTYEDWILAESQLQRTQILYRLIGNGDAGTGHVYRGITIADHIFEHDIVFAVDPKDELAIDKLDESNYHYRLFEDEQSILEYVQSATPGIVVNDVLDTSAEYVKKLKEHVPHVVNFEDLGPGANHADAVINALYEHSKPPQDHFFGFEYFCLRNEFRYAAPRTEIPSVDRIMVSFGGTDENNLTAKTLHALSDMGKEIHLDVVLGLGYTEQETLTPITEDRSDNISIEIRQDVNSMAEHMEQSDLLITSNGRTLYEAASLNLPAISIAQNQREQKHPYAHISRGVRFLGLADYVSKESIRSAIKEYIYDETTRESMRKALESHDISSGVDRIKNILFKNTDEN